MAVRDIGPKISQGKTRFKNCPRITVDLWRGLLKVPVSQPRPSPRGVRRQCADICTPGRSFVGINVNLLAESVRMIRAR